MAAPVLVAACVLAGSPQAQAADSDPAGTAAGGTAYVSGSTLYVKAGVDQVDFVQIDPLDTDEPKDGTSDVYRITDIVPLAAGDGCLQIADGEVHCDLTGLTTLVIHLGNLPDTLDGVRGTLRVIAYGEDGNDTLGSSNNDDTLYGGTGDDIVDGGFGDDLLYGGSGGDTFIGNYGDDTVSYADHLAGGVTADIDAETEDDGLPGEGDTITPSVENIVGSPWADSLIGGSGSDGLAGAGGNDTLLGGSGADHLDGGAGFDTLYGGSGPSASTVDVCLLGREGGQPIGCELVR